MKETTNIRRNIFTDLDTILDTRLSLAYILDPEGISKAIKTGGDMYRNRVVDNFGNISNDIFMQIYKKRKKYLLLNALPTPMIDMLKKQFELYLTDVALVELKEPPTLYLNIFPYRLTLEEQKYMMDYISNFIGSMDIKLVYMPYNKITPNYINENCIDIVVMYDILTWLEVVNIEHSLLLNPIVNLHCIGPALVVPQEIQNEKDGNIFDMQSSFLSSVTNIQFISASYFSAVNIKIKEEGENING